MLKQWFSSYFCFASAWLHQKSLTSDILIWLKNFHLSNPDSSWCYIISIFQVLTWVVVTQFHSPLKSHLVLLHNVHYPRLVDIIIHSFENYPRLQCCTSSSSGVPHYPTYNILHYPCLQCTLSSLLYIFLGCLLQLQDSLQPPPQQRPITRQATFTRARKNQTNRLQLHCTCTWVWGSDENHVFEPLLPPL